MLGFMILKINNFAAAAVPPCNPNTDNPQNNFFGFPHWWKYLDKGVKDPLGNCVPNVPFPDAILPIGMAIIDMLLYLGGIVAVFSIVYAGFSYMAAAGSPDKITASRKRIINSIVGLVIIVVAARVVAFIGDRLG